MVAIWLPKEAMIKKVWEPLTYMNNDCNSLCGTDAGQFLIAEPLESNEECQEKRVVRILTSDFPQFFALVSRFRQEAALIGADGGVISSTVVSQAQAVFPEGALQKRIRVGLQVRLGIGELWRWRDRKISRATMVLVLKTELFGGS